MTNPQPVQPRPAPDQPPPRTPLIDRVMALEDRLTELIRLHNKFADDVTRELGI